MSLDLDAIRARLTAATPGPWHEPHGEYGCVRSGNYGWVAPGTGPEYDVDTEQGMADAELVAHAPQDIADLLDSYEQLRRLVADLTDADPCWFDHHGGCQAHGYLSLEPGELCPHEEAKRLLAASEPGASS